MCCGVLHGPLDGLDDTTRRATAGARERLHRHDGRLLSDTIGASRDGRRTVSAVRTAAASAEQSIVDDSLVGPCRAASRLAACGTASRPAGHGPAAEILVRDADARIEHVYAGVCASRAAVVEGSVELEGALVDPVEPPRWTRLRAAR